MNVKALNGQTPMKLWVQGLMIGLQTLITIFGWQIVGFIKDHEDRIDSLEQFQAKGDRWTASQQLSHEQTMASQVLKIWQAIAELQGERN